MQAQPGERLRDLTAAVRRVLASFALLCAITCSPASLASELQRFPGLADARIVSAQALPAACAPKGSAVGILAAGGEDIFVLYRRGDSLERPEIHLRFESLRQSLPDMPGETLPFDLRETALLYRGEEYGGLRSVRCVLSSIDSKQPLLLIEYGAVNASYLNARRGWFIYGLVGPRWQRVYESVTRAGDPVDESRFYFNGIEGALCASASVRSSVCPRLHYAGGKLLVRDLATPQSPVAGATRVPERLELRVEGLNSAGESVALHIGKREPGDVICRREARMVGRIQTVEPFIECASSNARFALEVSTQPEGDSPAAALRVRISTGGRQILPAAHAARRVMRDSDGGQSQVLLPVSEGS